MKPFFSLLTFCIFLIFLTVGCSSKEESSDGGAYVSPSTNNSTSDNTTSTDESSDSSSGSGTSDTGSSDTSTSGSTFVYKLPDTGQTGNYTATFGEDSDYLINPPAYTDHGDGTVTDQNTGLMWQQQNDNVTRNWTDAGTYCGGLSLAGYNDWRLPDVNELQSIVDYGRSNPMIDPILFPVVDLGLPGAHFVHQSSTTYVDDSTRAWIVLLFAGTERHNPKSIASIVRCVRTIQNISIFYDNGDGTVTDQTTRLIWQQQDDNTTRTWENALSYCEGLSLASLSDWRLPNIKELERIVDHSRSIPAIDTAKFLNPIAWDYWSSTSRSNTSVATIYFGSGIIRTQPPQGIYFARCVRAGQ